MRTLSANIIGEVQKTHGDAAWRWLVTLQVSYTAVLNEVFSLTNHPSALTYASVSYKPFPFSVGVMESDDSGSLHAVELSLSNVTRDLSPYLQKADNLLGKDVTIRLVNVDHLTTAADTLATTYRVAGATMTRSTIGLRLETSDLHRLQYPEETFMRDRCRWLYGSAECGYVITGEGGVLTECNKTLADCTERGTEEGTRGRPIRHPSRFGGFPGLPRKIRG
jgi:phage-related protein